MRILIGWLFIVLAGCGSSEIQQRAVYLLVDTSSTDTEVLEHSRKMVLFFLSQLEPGDSLAVARADSGSFSEKDIIAKVTFDGRPSYLNAQKRQFAAVYDDFLLNLESSPYTDITGGILQAIGVLSETNAQQKQILIFSDLQEELPEGLNRDVELNLDGFTVIALNVTKLREDNADPQIYLDRVAAWRERIEQGKGQWRIINDLDRLDALLNYSGAL